MSVISNLLDLRNKYRAILNDDPEQPRFQNGNTVLSFPTLDDVHTRVSREVDDFLNANSMSDKQIQNAHCLYKLQTQIGEFSFLLNKNADQLTAEPHYF